MIAYAIFLNFYHVLPIKTLNVTKIYHHTDSTQNPANTITAKELSKRIKGGGNMDIPNQNGGFNYNPMMSSPMMMPIFGPTQQVPAPQSPTINMNPGFVPVPIFNMQGPTIPQFPNSPPNQNGDIAAYQQNLQRAFLQSAMAQNMQIQQQLLAQNQALQQLLVQGPNTNQTVG